MTIRNWVAFGAIVQLLVLSPLLAINPARADSESAQLCWAFGKYDHTVYYAAAEGREDRQASFASLMEVSGLTHTTLECRIENLASHRATRAKLLKQWRESEFEIVNTTFLSDLDY
jgi:hypothetical protein